MIDIVCPTHGRADRVLSTWIPGLILCVAASQEAAYKEHHPDLELVVHPDDVRGLASKRNWISEHFGDVFMVDDDVRYAMDTTSEIGKLDRIAPERIRPHIERIESMAADLGIYMYGFGPVADARIFKAHRPMVFTGFLPGHSFGLRKGHGLWWHPKCIQEDWWISLLNAHFHRMIVRDDRIAFTQKDTFTATGGQADHRTIGREEEAFRILREHFGAQVVKRKKDKNMHGLKHRHQPTVTLPF